MLGLVLGGGRIDAHAADRIGGAGRFLVGVLLGQIFVGIGGEIGFAAGGAEVIGLAAVLGLVLGGLGIDRHAADGIEHAACSRGVIGMVVMVVLGGAHDSPCNGLYYIPVGGI